MSNRGGELAHGSDAVVMRHLAQHLAIFPLATGALSKFLEDHTRELEQADRRRIHDGIAAALTRLNATGAEAEHERNARLTSGPDTGPLLRTLLRLRHDIVMLGRAVGCELPKQVTARLTPPLRNIEAAGSDFL